ncbi:MAG: caspase family protein [Thermoguttaceae bacterium]
MADDGYGRWIAALLILGAFAGPILGAFAVASGQDAAQRDLTRVGPSSDEPWLRINAGGHSASVRALTFSPDGKRLCSGGLDKIVEVWNLSGAARDIRRSYLRERTIRWQVARGLRGSIFALASAPSDGLLALGGYGAMGSLGEILLVHPIDGSLVKVLEGHRQTICSLSFSTDGNWLASSDAAGQSTLWRREGWQPRILYEADAKTYDARTARQIAAQPKLRPIAFVGNSEVVLPASVGTQADGKLGWKLQRMSVVNPGGFQTLETLHVGMVTALAANPDGSLLASADLSGKLYVWDLKAGGPPQELRPQGTVLSLAFSSAGPILVAGTAVTAQGKTSQLQIWDLTAKTLKRSRTLADHVHACAVSPDGKLVAYSGGKENEVLVERIEAPERTLALAGSGRRIWKVAFAREEPYYRVAFGNEPHDRGFNDYADLAQTFDPLRLELGDLPVKQADWLAADWLAGAWSARPQAGGSLQLYRDGLPQGKIVLDAEFEGRPRCHTWISDAKGRPLAIAVGTDVQNSVYVYRLAAQGPCPVLRHFRGHHDDVTSVGVSRDLRYLVSGSADGTINFWSLSGLEQGDTIAGRWGADLTVRGDQLVGVSVPPAGPLWFRGVRPGDVLEQIRWYEGSVEQSENQPAAMLERLRTLPWVTQVAFQWTRKGSRRPAFQILPAWQPLATLFINADRHWAFWTPQGYYDASINGYTLFGWQVNRGLHALPDFYRADQFRRKLERPDVMERLLPAGSLEAAFEAIRQQPPAESQQILPQQIAATPRVEILAPRPGEVIPGDATRVRARITMPGEGKLVQAKVFANGVVALKQQLLRERNVFPGKELTYEWEVRLPSDRKDLIQLVVATDDPIAAFSDLVVERPESIPPARPGRLCIVAVGINSYDDPAIQPLGFAVADAEAVVQTLRDRAETLYHIDRVSVLSNAGATPAAWRKALEEICRELKEKSQPDDLLVLFFAGHGIVDSQSQQYYYVGHDFKLDDLEKRDYSGCISWSDFRLLADVPCRKLVLLDTCHSGAIQPLRSQNLKSAVRALQEDMVFTLAASAGSELSAEKKAWRHGAFTKSLLEVLDGKVGDATDPAVTLDEVVRYVRRAVPALTGGRQNPTAAPDGLLSYMNLRLTRRGE